MAAVDVLGQVADRLVGGMMFHSDHADLCLYMGFRKLAKLHERGFRDDSASLRRVHRLCVRMVGTFPAQGRQERTRTLDRWHCSDRTRHDEDTRVAALKECMADWIEWEDGTSEEFSSAARRLWECGETSLSREVAKLAEDVDEELAGARDLMCRLVATGWDATIV